MNELLMKSAGSCKMSMLRPGMGSRIVHRRKIHTQGSGLFGVLGHGADLTDSKHFRRLNRSESDNRPILAKQVSAGWGHSTAVTQDGELLIWGRPYDFANLLTLNKIKGFSGFLAQLASRLTSKLGSASDGLYTSPQFVDGLDKVASAHCSAGLTVALTDSGDLYAFGMNKWGQCGTGDRTTQTFFSPQEVNLDTKIKSVDAGLQHCIALSRYGSDVFTWGKAIRGQCGVPNHSEEQFASPQLVQGIVGVVTGVSAGFNHSAAVTSDGAVYLWGKGMSENVKPATSMRERVSLVYEDQMTPRALEIPGGRKAVEICSSNYTLVVRCDDGSLWAMGSGEYDRLFNTRLMPVQQLVEDVEYEEQVGISANDPGPQVVWPAGARLKKGFTRVTIVTPSSAGLAITTSTSSTESSSSLIFEVVVNGGEAYLKEKNLIFLDNTENKYSNCRVKDYCSGWTHNIILLENQPPIV